MARRKSSTFKKRQTIQIKNFLEQRNLSRNLNTSEVKIAAFGEKHQKTSSNSSPFKCGISKHQKFEYSDNTERML
jgi:hypothetical protein